MKKLVSLLSAFMLAAALTAPVFAEEKSDDISIVVDDRIITIADQKPVIVDDRVLVPARSVFEALGATVTWNANDRTVVVQSQDNRTVLTLTIDNKDVRKVYYESVLSPVVTTVTLDVPASIMNDRTMIPLRGVSENIDSEVDWDEETRTVIIDSKQYLDILSNVTVAEGKTAKQSLADTLPKLSLSGEQDGDIVTVCIDLSNADAYKDAAFATESFEIKYDPAKFRFDSYETYSNDEIMEPSLTVANPAYSENSVFIASVFMAQSTFESNFSNGLIMKITFKALTNEPGEFALCNRYVKGTGFLTSMHLTDENKNSIFLCKSSEIYIDTTPITLGGNVSEK